MLHSLMSRRRAEDIRVDQFVDAIRRSEFATVPTPARTDTVAFPRIILAGTVAAAILLTGCGTTAPTQPATTVAPAAVSTQQLDGTDAGLITEPAPTVAELEEMEEADAAAAVQAQDVAPDAIPADIPAAEIAPVYVPPVAVEEPITEPQFPDFGEQYDVVTETIPADGQ